MTFDEAKKLTAVQEFEKFFTSRRGLDVEEDFKRIIVAADEKTEFPQYTLKDLICSAIDEENLRTTKPFNPSQACSLIKHLIGVQWEGGQGELKNSGGRNVFYVRVKKVLRPAVIRWTAAFGCPRWEISVYYETGCHGWHPGDRLFSCN